VETAVVLVEVLTCAELVVRGEGCTIWGVLLAPGMVSTWPAEMAFGLPPICPEFAR
jgi:hypothetical protein